MWENGADFLMWKDLKFKGRLEISEAAYSQFEHVIRDCYYYQVEPAVRSNGFQGLVIEYSLPMEHHVVEIESSGKVISYIQPR